MSSIRASRDVIIRTDKWADATRFYETVLGFAITKRYPGIVGFETGAIQLFVEQGEPHGPVFDFLVPDVRAAKERLLEAGCTLVEEDPSVPRCYLRDPYGVVFNVGQAPAPKA